MISRSRSSTTRVSYGPPFGGACRARDDPRLGTPATADSSERSLAVQHDPHPDAARPPRSRGGGVVATSTVPAVRFVRVRHAGTERRLRPARPPARASATWSWSRGPRRAIEELLSLVGDGQPGRVMERASSRARPAALAARAAAVRRPARGSRGPAPDDRVRRRPAMLRVDVARRSSATPSVGRGSRRRARSRRSSRASSAIGVEGLPVGPDASAVLANAVLAQVDRTLREAGRRAPAVGRRRRPVRRRHRGRPVGLPDGARVDRAAGERDQDEDRGGRPRPRTANAVSGDR